MATGMLSRVIYSWTSCLLISVPSRNHVLNCESMLFLLMPFKQGFNLWVRITNWPYYHTEAHQKSTVRTLLVVSGVLFKTSTCPTECAAISEQDDLEWIDKRRTKSSLNRIAFCSQSTEVSRSDKSSGSRVLINTAGRPFVNLPLAILVIST